VTESISAILLRRFLGLLRRFAAGLARQAERPKAFGVGEDCALPGLVFLHRQRRVARAVFFHRGLGRLIGACLGGPCGLVRGRASMKRRLAPPHDHEIHSLKNAQQREPRAWRTRRGARNHSLASTSVVKAAWLVRCRLGALQIFRGRLAGLAIGHDLVRDLLAFAEGAHSSAFDRADVNEDVLAAVLRLNETETLLAVKPLHGARAHKIYPLVMCS